MKISALLKGLTAAMLLYGSITAHAQSIEFGDWKITLNNNKSATFNCGGADILKNVYVRALDSNESELLSTSYPNVELSKESISDAFGNGEKYTFRFSGLSGKDNLEQVFYFYNGNPNFFTEAYIVSQSGSEIKCRWIAPIVTNTKSTFLPATGDNRILNMPFDNDQWRDYSAIKWVLASVGITSCEVSALYDVTGRKGLCVGSVEHNTWKTGVEVKTYSTNTLSRLQVYGGLVSATTNDMLTDKPQMDKHGAVVGTRVKSPKVFVGLFSNWREGLEAIGDATATLQPKLPWNNGTIFAWQSWGGMAENVNYTGAMDVADFFHTQLEPKGFHNENSVCYMVLDSYWDNLNETELQSFASHCTAQGQVPGIYWTPFSFWGSENDLDWSVPGDGNSGVTYRSIALTANGQVRKISGISLDPTHPAVLRMIDWRLKQFHDWGYKYVKLDFLNNGSQEADSFYADGITTGMQAYDYGMKYLTNKALEYGMFIDLSIAPCFPAYGHARRMSCDAWNTIEYSEYVLNSLTLGWWLDRVYQYNDPDHIVLRDVTEGANRIRYTTGVLTGTMLLGDNFSLTGSCVGKQDYRDRALSIATNEAVNAVAQIGKSFRPVEGSMSNSFQLWGVSKSVDNLFYLDTTEAYYLAAFNYSDEAKVYTLDYSRLGISPSDIKSITELWTGESHTVTSDTFSATVPAGDVSLYKFNKQSGGVELVKSDADDITVTYNCNVLKLSSATPIANVKVIGMDGTLRQEAEFNSHTQKVSLSLSHLSSGIYLIIIELGNGLRKAIKLENR